MLQERNVLSHVYDEERACAAVKHVHEILKAKLNDEIVG
jgi:hypothetical protein